MNKLRQSFRRKKDVYVPESSRPHQWQTDEEAVRSGKCSFAVKVTILYTWTHLKTKPHRHTILQNAALTWLLHIRTSEKPALCLAPQGRRLWLIISIQNLWAQLLSGLQDYVLEPSKPVGSVCTIDFWPPRVLKTTLIIIKICTIEEYVSL